MFGHKHHQQPPPPPAGVGYPSGAPMPQHEPTFKIFCRADEAYCLTIRHDAVALAPTNPRDEYQHWYKDMRHSARVKDAEGHPAFALVNKATGLAVKHSLGQSHPVKLVPYNPEYLDESVLWTESNDVGNGFRCIRMVNNIHLNFDALHGDKSHGGVHDGTGVVLWEWCKGYNQSWKILPWGTRHTCLRRQLTAAAGTGTAAVHPAVRIPMRLRLRMGVTPRRAAQRPTRRRLHMEVTAPRRAAPRPTRRRLPTAGTAPRRGTAQRRTRRRVQGMGTATCTVRWLPSPPCASCAGPPSP